MKRLDKKYKKIKVQQTKCIVLFYHGMACDIHTNLIGFHSEFFSLEDTIFKNNFYRFNHLVYSQNNKLYKKYPTAVRKTQYKQWLRDSE